MTNHRGEPASWRAIANRLALTVYGLAAVFGLLPVLLVPSPPTAALAAAGAVGVAFATRARRPDLPGRRAFVLALAGAGSIVAVWAVVGTLSALGGGSGDLHDNPWVWLWWA